jgi:hypothetical protein
MVTVMVAETDAEVDEDADGDFDPELLGDDE